MSTDMATVEVKVGSGPPPAYGIEGGREPPPTYSNDPPPSYESVFGRVKQMRDESSGNAEFAKKMIGCVVCGSVCGIVMIIIMVAIPIACIVFGVLYKDDCTIESYIPIYLIVAGAFGLVKAVLGIIQQICKKRDGDDDDESGGRNKCLSIIDGPISCFLGAWFIAGSVWVYKIHGEVSSDVLSLNYCDPTLYQFAFWILTAQYIMAAVALFCCCVIMMIACCVASKSDS